MVDVQFMKSIIRLLVVCKHRLFTRVGLGKSIVPFLLDIGGEKGQPTGGISVPNVCSTQSRYGAKNSCRHAAPCDGLAVF